MMPTTNDKFIFSEEERIRSLEEDAALIQKQLAGEDTGRWKTLDEIEAERKQNPCHQTRSPL